MRYLVRCSGPQPTQEHYNQKYVYMKIAQIHDCILLFSLICFVSYISSVINPTSTPSGIIVGMGSENERRRYIVTSSLIAWAHTHWDLFPRMIIRHPING